MCSCMQTSDIKTVLQFPENIYSHHKVLFSVNEHADLVKETVLADIINHGTIVV